MLNINVRDRAYVEGLMESMNEELALESEVEQTNVNGHHIRVDRISFKDGSGGGRPAWTIDGASMEGKTWKELVDIVVVNKIRVRRRYTMEDRSSTLATSRRDENLTFTQAYEMTDWSDDEINLVLDLGVGQSMAISDGTIFIQRTA